SIACTDICDERQRAVGAARPCHRSNISHECVSAKDGFDAIEIDAKPPYLDLPVLAADSFQQPVGPLPHQVSGAKNSPSAVAAFNLPVSKMPPDPTSQGHVAARNHELADFTGGGRAPPFID